MHFRIVFLAIFATACGAKIDTKSGIVGQKLDDSTSLYNAYGINSDAIYLVDTPTRRILQVDLGQMTVENAYALSNPDEVHTLAASYQGAYVIDFSTKHLEVIRSDGRREEHPFGFQGTPVSAAYNPVKGIMAMQDDLQSIGLIMLDESGKILKSWLGGSLIDKGKSLLAGDIDSSGRLILAVSDHSLAIVDVEKSIDASVWKTESFDTAVDHIYWVAPDNEQTNLCLVLAKDAIAVVNQQTGIVTEKIVLSKKRLTVLGESKLVKPHILTSNSSSGREEVYFIGNDGKLASHELLQSTIAGYSVSYLDTKASELTVLFSNDDAHRVTKLRLSDNLVVFDDTVRSKGEAQLGPEVLFINMKTQLGYLQSHNLTDNIMQELKGYNFDYFRNN